MPDNDADEDTGAQSPAAADAEVGDDNDDRSSSLSDPIDEEDEEEHANGIKETIAQTSVHQSLEVDSEAETERLDHTPDKTRKQGDNAGKTPSKLSQAATADDDLSDPPSPIPVGPGAASSTSTVETAGQKRKRSDTVDSSLTSADSNMGESPRKRSHSSGADDANTDKEVANAETIEETEEPTVSNDADDTLEVQDSSVAIAPKVGRGRKPGKQKGKYKKGIAKETAPETEVAEVTAPAEEEQSEEAAAKSAEDLKHKQAASTVFEDVVKQFASFREKIFSERLAAVDAELEMLNQSDCKHPEFLRQNACVEARHQKQVNEAKAFYKYKMESLRRSTLGERSQLHSQYFQHARELREDVMYKLGEDWYNIQKERRESGMDDNERYIYKLPTKKSAQLKQQAKYNQEVSVLSGIAKYVGFPAAPDISGAEGDSLEDDMKAMKLSKKATTASSQPAPVHFPNRTGLVQPQSERIAHEQFLEQTPWARPQAPIHNHAMTSISHTPDWAAEPGLQISKHLVRNLSGSVQRNGSPFATPMPQRKTAVEHSSSGTVPANSDPVEPPSSVIAAPPTSDRNRGQFGREQASPLAVAKHRQNGGERELTGFRNISNISGASTIDATPDSAEKERSARESLPGIHKESSAPQHIFGTSQLQHPDSKKQQEAYANVGFRPQEGAFGTPTPLPATSGAP
ncbi:hypothetical protein M409DRAFT_27834 [Zasmidium cellare ATCC 36951]|uniref:Transcriptional regulatory protein DEP1 n=1 Tax=Zasmidium cellare ATCC 36951 TaxID=1080233 RepID=A0A6A6C699_ZASCE|nr:uncharacterized protein M409DRAFT_27834 [Zasmidium cellare ATCC 36951]KAF2161778.1 hypothetical protein M409DRAFT_27834 [Zasmidium cellare ATCC 36951]